METNLISQNPAVAGAASPRRGALSYLDRAVNALTPLGFSLSRDERAVSPVVGMLAELAKDNKEDQTKAVVIAKTLQYGSLFNEVVRSEIADMSIGNRYEAITGAFDSIIADTKGMVSRVEQNRHGWREKVGLVWMKISRGSIHSRFQKIRVVYQKVAGDTRDQLDREEKILTAYQDYRGALKEAEIAAVQLKSAQDARLEAARNELAKRNQKLKMLDALDPASLEAVFRAQLARDEAQRDLDTQERRANLLANISEQLVIAYNVGDTIMANLNQTRQVKQGVYEKSVVFFSANESVFTAIDANFTATVGLNEAHRTVDALTSGMNRSLDALAEAGTTVKMNALKSAYGPTVRAETVRKLVESMLAFQEQANREVRALKAESAANAGEIARVVEDGKQRFAEIQAQAALTNGE